MRETKVHLMKLSPVFKTKLKELVCHKNLGEDFALWLI